MSKLAIRPAPPKLIVDPAEVARAEAANHKPVSVHPGFVRQLPTPNMQRALAAEAAQPFPRDFGVPGGTAITNFDTLLPDLYKELGRNGPPAFMGILTEGATMWGHAAAAYTLPSGEQICMNIVGRRGQDLVNFMSPEEFIAGVSELDRRDEKGELYTKENGELWKNPEGGIYHRNYLMVMAWDVPNVERAHAFYQHLGTDFLQHDARFKLLPTPVRDSIDALRGDKRTPYNCVLAASTGAAMAGVIPRPMRVPRDFLMEMIVNNRQNPDNVDIVHFEWAEGAVRTGKDLKTGRFFDPTKKQLAPLSALYKPGHQLADRAAVKVVVEPGTRTAVFHVNKHGRAPSRI